MTRLTQEQIIALKAKVTDAAKKSPFVVDGWCKATSLGGVIKNEAQIDYKSLGYENLRSFIQDIFGPDFEQRGTPPQHEYRISECHELVENQVASDIKGNELPTSYPVRERPRRENAYQRILRFAFFPKPTTFLKNGFHFAIKKLAEKALDEHWFYGEVDPGDFPILRNYFLMTFDRLQSEDDAHRNDSDWEPKMKIVANENNTFGISRFDRNGTRSYIYPKEILLFNTGLVDKLYEPIYAVFVTNDSPSIPWKFYKFISGSGEDREHMFLAKLYGDKFPKRAKYYDSTLELVYDIYKPIGSYNWGHIIDRCDRLPIDFLEDNCANELKASRDSDGNINFETLAQSIKRNPRIYLRIQNRIQDAIDHSLKRVEWNFKTAIPIYFPGGKSISLLLPLSLVGDNNVIDAALVLENDSAYIAHTILTLNMAYANARLITHPDSDWLTPSNISLSNKDSDDDDD